MQGATHAAAGFAVGSYIAMNTGRYLAIPVGVLGGLACDLDLPKSKAGRKAGFISVAINAAFGHRTLFHAPLVYFLLCILGINFFPFLIPEITAFTYGALLHIFFDTFNAAGIPYFYPVWTKTFSLGSAKVGGLADKILFVVMSAVSALLLYTISWPHLSTLLEVVG